MNMASSISTIKDSSASTAGCCEVIEFLQELVPSSQLSIDDKSQKIRDFVDFHNSRGNKIVLVTSGGTAVPLESRTIRYIDNFSIGTRGATSAEYFLHGGYAVIFLHRLRSLLPFVHRVNSKILDILQVSEDGTVTVSPNHTAKISSLVMHQQSYQDDNMLLTVDFTTLPDYLLLLREAALQLRECKGRALLYLAAAVSDFYIPHNQMPEHKIQSSEGDLKLSLQMTPKILKPLVKEWVPDAFVVSFKLETDPSILMDKARKALDTYQHQLVIANVLDTRKQEVRIVSKDDDQLLRLTDSDMAEGKEIEEPLVGKLSEYHSQFIQSTVSA